MYEKVPKELKENGLFCLWRKEEVKGKITKVPYKTDGRKASSNQRSDFSKFDSIVSHTKGYDGIGLGIFDGYSAIDIDHCIKDGIISEMAQDIINTMKSYTEVSPSGNGIRIIFKAIGLVYDKNKYYINNQKVGLEVYIAGSTSKYVTITGNALNDLDIASRTDEVHLVVEKYMKRKPKVTTTHSAVQKSYLSDEEVILKAKSSKNSVKFERLYNGDITGYPSHSEADIALCMILSFWCGGDKEQINRLFRESKLYRDKWERDDYRNDTLDYAVSNTKEYYEPPKVESPFFDFTNTYQNLTTLKPDKNHKFRWSDIGNGRLFAELFKDIARYVPSRKSWYIFDGTKWVKDDCSLKAIELCKSLADLLLLYANSLKRGEKGDFPEFAIKWQKRTFRDVVLREAQSIYPISMDAFDKDIYLVNCKNGTLDLRDFNFREHSSCDLITKMANVIYDKDASSDRFTSYIDEVMDNDKDRAKFLQKVIGYGISGDTRFECMFILSGKNTRNGKGTLMESCLGVLGDYACAVSYESIAQKNYVNSQGPKEDLARLAGIRYANISEPRIGLVLDVAKIKTLTGNDTINARFLNENSFDYKPQFKLYINTNHLPIVNDVTVFKSSRIYLIPFEHHFEEATRDTGLKKLFREESVKSAIFNWMVEGYRLLMKEGLKPPTSVIEATNIYHKDSDKILQFMDDELIEDSASEVKNSLVYNAYLAWCSRNGYMYYSIQTFTGELRRYGEIVKKRPKAGGEKTTLLLGFKLATEFLE